MRSLFLGFTLLAACGGTASVPSIFPEEYEATYTQTRECRASSDHDNNHVTVFTDPLSTEPYQNRDKPFPVGSIIVKPQYSSNDKTCTGPIIQWTVMKKLADGSSPDTHGWQWQRIDARKKVVTNNDTRCIDCHWDCGSPDSANSFYGYQYTCSAQGAPPSQ